jgi:glycosyltransferase involved in cell wall biosynthesis
MGVSTEPLVFIGLPTRSRAACLRESVKDILAQDYRNIEVLISDNCSDDDTEQVCRELTAADRRVGYVRQPRNIGLHGNHNFCMDASRGEFLCLFHDHDRRAPTLIGEYVRFLQAHPRVGIVSSDWDLIDDADAPLGPREWEGPAVTPGLDYISETIRTGRSSIGTPGAMVRRKALGSTRFGLEAPIGFGDFPIWFRIAETWDIGHISKRLWSWRQNSVSHSARPIQSIARDFAQNLGEYCDGHLARWPEHAALVDRWRAHIKRYLFWALAYEVGLHFRTSATAAGRRSRTLFEIMDYHLTPEQFEETLAQMKQYRTGATEHVAFAAVSALVYLRVTSPLGWVIRHQAVVRTLLGLK